MFGIALWCGIKSKNSGLVWGIQDYQQQLDAARMAALPMIWTTLSVACSSALPNYR
jgi:hypothetical protein